MWPQVREDSIRSSSTVRGWIRQHGQNPEVGHPRISSFSASVPGALHREISAYSLVLQFHGHLWLGMLASRSLGVSVPCDSKVACVPLITTTYRLPGVVHLNPLLLGFGEAKGVYIIANQQLKAESSTSLCLKVSLSPY